MATTSKRVDSLLSVNVSSARGDEQPLAGAGPRQSRGARAAGACFHGVHCVLTLVLVIIVAVFGTALRDRRKLITELQNPAVLFTQGQPGVSGYTPYGSLFRGSGSWVVSPDQLPGGGLSDHGVVSIGDYAYVIGGTSVSAGTTPGALTGRIYRYDTIYGIWSTSLPAMAVPYTRFGFAASADTIFVVGGIGGDIGSGCFDPTCTPSGVNMATSDDVEGGNPGRTGWATLAYNVTAGRWRTDLAAVRLNVPRSDSCAAVINGKVYVVGGYSDFYNITDSLEVLDPAAAAPRWRQLAPLPSPRGDLGCAALNGLLYVFGGYYDPYCATPGGCFNTNVTQGGDPKAGAGAVDGVSNFRAETWSYNPATNAWTARSPMRYVRGDAAFAVLPNGRLVVAGGERNLRTLEVKVPQHSVEMYYADQDTWAEKAPMPYARFRFAAAAVGQSTYVFGGQAVCALRYSGLSACQTTAADSHSVFFELDHPNVFVQLPNAAGNGLTYDMALILKADANATTAGR